MSESNFLIIGFLFWLRSATLGGVTRRRLRALKLGGGPEGCFRAQCCSAHGGSADISHGGCWISRAAFPLYAAFVMIGSQLNKITLAFYCHELWQPIVAARCLHQTIRAAHRLVELMTAAPCEAAV